MSEEANLLAELRDIHAEYERLNDRMRLAAQQQRYGITELERKNAGEEVAKLLREIDRLMTRMRAIEGNLKAVREKGRRRFL